MNQQDPSGNDKETAQKGERHVILKQLAPLLHDSTSALTLPDSAAKQDKSETSGSQSKRKHTATRTFATGHMRFIKRTPRKQDLPIISVPILEKTGTPTTPRQRGDKIKEAPRFMSFFSPCDNGIVTAAKNPPLGVTPQILMQPRGRMIQSGEGGGGGRASIKDSRLADPSAHKDRVES